MEATEREGGDFESLSSLEERIVRAVEVVSRLRQENDSLRRQLEEALAEKAETDRLSAEARTAAARLAQDMDNLRSERKQVRTRIEKLLGQMDLLSEG